MYYTNGNYSMGGNFKIKKQGPIDDRSTVSKKIDLQNSNLFDGFTYNGMIVSVVDDTVNNGIYRLEDKTTKTWIKEGANSTTDLTNYYNKTQVDAIASNKVDKVAGKQLSTEDYTTADKNKLTGLSNYTKPASEPISYITGLQTALDSKVSKIGAEALHSTDALRISGTTLSLYKGDGTFESVVTQDTVYTLPKASATVLGGIKVGTNLSIDANGVLSVNDTNVSFTEISNKPTNLSGYGITDAYTKTEVDTKIADIPSADLTNYYTKQDTDSLLDTKQDTLVSGTNIKTINGQSVLGNGNIFVTSLGSSVTLGEYGVRWNQETDVYEALGSVHRTQIQGNMKRCVLKDDGTVNYYLHPKNSTLKDDSTPADLTGADGNVMVEVPKFWYKHTLVVDTHEWWISNTPLDGYSVHPWFLEGGVERPFRYYRAYTCTNVAGKLMSISGSTPTRSQTRATFRTQARANGTGWGLCSWNALNAIQLLFLTEYCTFNSQAVLGRGNDAGGDYGITTGQSNSIGNASSGPSNNDMWMSYRGIENWYADCGEFIDGINVQNYKVFLSQNHATFADNVFTGYYVDSGVTLPVMSASYIKKISGEFLPTAVGGSSSTYITDAGWLGTGNRVVLFGGAASNLQYCGAFSLNALYAFSDYNVGVGSGLSL